MRQVFELPDLGEGIHEGEIVSILVTPGDEVTEGVPILVVETDKAAVEIPSPHSGTVSEILVEEGELVRVGQALMAFEIGTGERQAGGAQAEATAEAATGTESRTRVERSEGAIQGGPAATRQAEAAGLTPVPPPGTEIATPVPASPATRRLARELGVDLRLVAATGPAGLVTADDVRRFAAAPGVPGEEEAARSVPPAKESKPEVPPSTVCPPLIGVPDLPDFSHWGPVEKVPLRSVRRAIAKQMALSWAQIPHVTHQETADISELEEFRRQHKQEFAAEGLRLTVTLFVLKAVTAALKAHPRFNASLVPDTEEIVLKHYYHIGVATDTERGLTVPVLRDVDRKSIRELARELQPLLDRVRAGKASVADLQGGTFTITNIGSLGGSGFTPIINYPQAAILGMGRARLQPVVHGTLEDHRVVARLLLPLVLAFDHRLVDGADAARFMNKVVTLLEDPGRLTLEA